MGTANNDKLIAEDVLFEDPLYCTFSELLHTVHLDDSISPQEIWARAKACFRRLSVSSRPDLTVSSVVDELCHTYSSGDTAIVILICTMYMIGCQDKEDNPLWEAGKRIGAVIGKHPLRLEMERYQRIAEEREEDNGNPIPNRPYLETQLNQLEENHPTEYGCMRNRLPTELLSCIADLTRFDEYCQIIRNNILPFIKSEEGTAQMWKVVLSVSQELGYISSKCKTNRFAQLIATICPEAGTSAKIDQNMQKYNRIKKENENDLYAIRSRFIEF